MNRLIFFSIVFLSFARAADTCPAHPCMIKNKFDKEACEKKSAWVAQGKIVKSKNDPNRLDFLAHQWIKSGEKRARKITLINDKCFQHKAPRAQANTSYIFYGKAINKSNNSAQYYYFQEFK